MLVDPSTKRRNHNRDILDSDTASEAKQLEVLGGLLHDEGVDNYSQFLPIMFQLKGRPYSLVDHFPFEPFFDRNIPPYSIAKAGRQLGKSVFQASRGVLIANSIPHFTTLYVFPLYEQVRRFSDNYVRKFIEESPFHSVWVENSKKQNMRQKYFKNRSSLVFSFAGQSVDRIRGLSANMVNFDETQDIDRDHLPIILEVTSASVVYDTAGRKRYRSAVTFTGTPKTFDTLLEEQWKKSSKAEWAIPCHSCKKLNIPSIDQDLIKMIGPYHRDIGESHHGKRPGTVCANSKCARPIDPRDGHWEHQSPDLAATFPGRHIPQILMPMHYAEPEQWRKLVGKMEGGYSTARFYNEVLGESYDQGLRVISEAALRGACLLPWKNTPRDLTNQCRIAKTYFRTYMGVDWGGGGETNTSFTTIAVLGEQLDGKVDVIYGERLVPDDPLEEAKRVLHVFASMGCRVLAHDYNGAGNLREAYLIQAGVPLSCICPFVYNRTAHKDIVVPHRAGENNNSRNFWILDKARSLQLVCELIRQKRIRFFEWDYVDIDRPGVLSDFTSLVEHKYETARAGEVYGIRGSGNSSDDFAHSVNFACCAMWHSTQNYPSLVDLTRYTLSPAQHQAFNEGDIAHIDLESMGGLS